MGIDPVSIFLFVASTVYQNNQQKKQKERMEAEAEKRKGFKFSTSGETGHLPIVYGKQALGGFQTLHKTFSSYTNASKPGDVFTAGNWNSNRSGSKNEFLLVQSALCQDGVDSLVYAKVNDKPYDHVETDNDGENNSPYDNIISFTPDGGTANSLATANGASANNYFTDTASATMIYKLNRDEPQYQGVPGNTFFVKGRRVRTVNSLGTLSSSYTYSNNPAWCLLDYLLGDFGRNLDPSEVDLISFYNAATICSQIVSTGRAIGGRINNVRPIKELSTYSVFPAEGDTDFIYKAEDTGIYYNWSGSSYSVTTVPTRDIPLYECNIALDSESTVRDNIERILGTMGMAEMIWTFEGKYKLVLDYPSSLAALQNLVDPDHVFLEDDIIRENVTISYPSAKDRFNRVTVRFDNEHEDFKEDSMSWPPLNGSVHQQYLSEDNNQPMTTDMSLDGITDPYHALAKAEQMVRQSRTTHYISLTVGKKGLSIEPGDFIKIDLPQSGINNSVYRVESIRISADLTVELNCYYFDFTALAWNIDDDIPYGNPPTYDFVVPKPTNVTVTPAVYTSPDGNSYTSLEVEWSVSDSVSIARYEVQWKKASETEYQSAFTRNNRYVIQNVESNVEYGVRVRAATGLGVNSNFTNETGTNVGKDIPPNPPTGLSASGGYGYISLSWQLPSDADLKEIEIYESSSDIFDEAVSIGKTSGNNFIRSNLAPQIRKYYWIRSIDRTGNTSSFLGPKNSITDQLNANSFAANTIPYNSFDTGVSDIFDGIVEDISTANTAISNNNTAISNLATKVTTAEENITSSATDITALNTSLTTANTNISGNATAISGIDTRVTAAEATITSQASSLTTLTSTVGGNTTSISTQATTINGIQSQHSVEIDNNGSITGYRLISNPESRSAFNVVADQFNVSNDTGTNYSVFSVRTESETIGGVTYPAGAYVTGRLEADNIVAGTLSSITADIGSVTAGTITSAAGNMVMDLDNGTIIVRDDSDNLRVKIGDLS